MTKPIPNDQAPAIPTTGSGVKPADGGYDQGAADAKAHYLEAIELAYGLLWTVPAHLGRPEGRTLRLARQALLAQLDRDGQARGISAARLAIEAESRKNSRTGNDDYTNPFGYQRKSADD